MDNSTLALIDHGLLTSQWFRKQNPGQHLGDTGNDIIQGNDTLIAISVNWSNILQYIRPDGTAIAATEDIRTTDALPPTENLHLATSYADGGYVAKDRHRHKADHRHMPCGLRTQE